MSWEYVLFECYCSVKACPHDKKIGGECFDIDGKRCQNLSWADVSDEFTNCGADEFMANAYDKIDEMTDHEINKIHVRLVKKHPEQDKALLWAKACILYAKNLSAIERDNNACVR